MPIAPTFRNQSKTEFPTRDPRAADPWVVFGFPAASLDRKHSRLALGN
ncbi:hypothetical protein VAR608DRAFT_1602 [Variovorax sp. HW608]|nr:hypothetical protein VAR608DRAFT_1602 [Variovorax sp. HW608]